MTIAMPQATRVDDANDAGSSTHRGRSRVRGTLLGADYSPWTERARWALDHHGIAYRFEEHIPVVGEFALRRRTRGRRGARATVPVFFDGEVVIAESLDIIVHADAVGRGVPLVGDRAATARFFERVERALVAVRGRVLASVLADPEAQRDSAAVLSKSLAGLLRPLVRMSTRVLASKYDVSGRKVHDLEQEMRAMLLDIRRSIDDGTLSPETLTANHLAAATFVQGVSPVRADHIGLTPAMRRAWTCEPLANEFADVMAWRDDLYAHHRGTPSR